jgi:hypothetical protein
VVDLLDLIRKVLTVAKAMEPIEKTRTGEAAEITLAHDNPDVGAQ